MRSNGRGSSVLQQNTKRFTLVELLVMIAIIAILMSMVIASWKKAQEKGREIFCMNNLHQIAIGYAKYMDYYETATPFPPSGAFLDDLSPVLPYVKNFETFKCPSTKTPYYKSVPEMALGFGDYNVCIFNKWEDLERASASNHGMGNNPYSFDPSNPGFTKKGGTARFARPVVYENKVGNHFKPYRNVVYINDGHYERVMFPDPDNRFFLLLIEGGHDGRRIDLTGF
jgi:type II secretory pathway pseudopilin PulG